MVSYDSSWVPGDVSGVWTYNAPLGDLKDMNTLLNSDAVVDVNAPTRIQYPVSEPFGNYMAAKAVIKVGWDDQFYATAPAFGGVANSKITVMLYLAPANLLPSNPDALAIMGKSTLQIQSGVYGTPPVNGWVTTTFDILGPSPAQLQPNTKYWALFLPVAIVPGAPPSQARLLHSSSTAPNGLARAISFWSNRTPAAPVITSPTPNSIVPSGSLMNLNISPGDPDGAYGGVSPQYTDVAGVHVQYAPRPTPANPNPPWIDLPFANNSGTVHNIGWWIQNAASNIPGGGGASTLATAGTVKVKVGSNTPTANAGLLPSGSWQIRVRTFDFGHATPLRHPPLGASVSGGNFSPSNYPSVNTSPWSNPVIITVSAQVPAPTPLFPINNSAIPADTPVTLSWQYRNTAVPPFPQSKRSIRIRVVGTSTWANLLVNNASSSTIYALTGYTLVSGNRYEWQVQVTDSDNVQSTWSESATFWVVPKPASGGGGVLPSDTIDGATLGCGNNRAFIYRRGGKTRVGEITGITSLEWNRLRDDISTTQIKVSGWTEDCGYLLSQLEPWAYEIVIFRDNGYSVDRVWEGPITLLSYEQDTVTIDAKDVMAYAYRRIMRQEVSDAKAGDSVVSRATRILQNAFAPDDPNILQYLTVIAREDDAMQYRTTPAYSRTAFEEVDDMAANAGLDYTAIGRSIILWGTKHRIGTLPEFQNKDLGAPPIVSVYGMSMANVYVVSDGNGVFGEATRLDVNGQDLSYGLVEMLSSSWASDSEPDEGTYTQEGLNKIRQSFAESAERSIASRYPPPLVVRVPDNTTINPDAVISIQQLVPGVVLPLRSTGTLRTVVASQKLDAVKVVQASGKETITFTLSPFSRDDAESTEGAE